MDEIRMAIEIRADEGRLGPGRLFGVVMKYNTRAADRPELFEDGALKWPDDSGIVLNRQHSRQIPIMRVKPIVVGDEVRIDQRLPDTEAGRSSGHRNQALPNGLFKGLSIEFVSLKESFFGRHKANILCHAAERLRSLTCLPYSAAAVEVRAKPRQKRRRVWL